VAGTKDVVIKVASCDVRVKSNPTPLRVRVLKKISWIESYSIVYENIFLKKYNNTATGELTKTGPPRGVLFYPYLGSNILLWPSSAHSTEVRPFACSEIFFPNFKNHSEAFP
jgi:hypothetical protein